MRTDEPEEHSDPPDTSEPTQADESNWKSKLKTVGTAFGLGTTGYMASILWTIPFRESTRLPGLEASTSSQLIMNNIALALGAITIGILYFRFSEKNIQYIDLNIPDKRQFALIVGGTLALLLAFFAIGTATSFFGNAQPSEHTMAQTVTTGDLDPQFLLLMVPISFLVIGPAEEFVFRNLVQKRLYEDFTKLAAVVISSLIFAVVHYPAYATGPIADVLLSLGSVFTFSLILGGAYAWSENLLVPAVMHGTYNAAIFMNWYTALAHGFVFL